MVLHIPVRPTQPYRRHVNRSRGAQALMEPFSFFLFGLPKRLRDGIAWTTRNQKYLMDPIVRTQ